MVLKQSKTLKINLVNFFKENLTEIGTNICKREIIDFKNSLSTFEFKVVHKKAN